MAQPDIKYLFEPRSVAVIGASATPGKIGYLVMDNILTSGFKGEVYPINPKGGEVLGKKVYNSVCDIEGEVDIAVITVPAKLVLAAVQECAKKHVKFIPIITSGFSEVGEKELEKEIVRTANEGGCRVLGPNIFGIYSSAAPVNATFGPKVEKVGNVGIITQSGALGIAMIGKAGVDNLGLSTIVSVGNKSDIDEVDLLEYLIKDDNTRTILMYMEGVHNGPKFVETLRKVTKIKPVVVLKSGRSKRGAMAAASHTGSLAGTDEVFDAVMKQCGVIRADTIQEAFDWCKFLGNAPVPQGENCVIVTNGGGVGVMCTDACEKYNIKLYDDQAKLKEQFTPMTPAFGSTKNPVDITGQAKAEDYAKALSVGVTSDEIHGCMALYCQTGTFDIKDMQAMCEQAYADYTKAGKPIIFSLLGDRGVESVVDGLKAKGIPAFNDIYNAVACLGALMRQTRFAATQADEMVHPAIDAKKIADIVANAKADGRNFLLAAEGQDLLKAAGLTMPAHAIAKTADEAVKFADEITYPVVMKIVSRDILHKSDAGGVKVGVKNADEVRAAFDTILTNIKNYKADAQIDGIEICEMVKPGVEVIIGARQDGSFGPTAMFGLGGIYVEVMKDVTFRSLPISKSEVSDMVKSIRSYKLLTGVRGEKAKDIASVEEAIIRVGEVLQCCDQITDIEVNPLEVYEDGKGTKAVDIRVMLKK